MHKGLTSLFIILGGLIGSYIPVWLGQSGFSIASIIGGGIGSILGIIAAYKLSNYF